VHVHELSVFKNQIESINRKKSTFKLRTIVAEVLYNIKKFTWTINNNQDTVFANNGINQRLPNCIR